MKDLPIIFSAPMVRALLAGRKTMTRRLAWKTTWRCGSCGRKGKQHEDCAHCGLSACIAVDKPSPWQKVAAGDRLWVRESLSRSGALVGYVAGGSTSHRLWGEAWKQDPRPSIHMPRWASRLTLVVTATKIERLQDISEEDARAEGVEKMVMDDEGKFYLSDRGTYRCGFAGIWSHLHGPESWESSPEVVCLTFAVHKANIDQMAKAAE
jgi:hypothetical protein